MFPLFLVVVLKGHCLPKVEFYRFQSFRLLKYTNMNVLYLCMDRRYFLQLSKTNHVYTNFIKPIFCMSPNSITLPSFMYQCIEIRKFNRKKRNLKHGFFTISVVKMNLFLDTVVAMISLKRMYYYSSDIIIQQGHTQSLKHTCLAVVTSISSGTVASVWSTTNTSILTPWVTNC